MYIYIDQETIAVVPTELGGGVFLGDVSHSTPEVRATTVKFATYGVTVPAA